jgi:hypothetical protein
MISEIARPECGARQRFRLLRGEPDGFFKATLGGGVIEVVAVSMAEIEQDVDVGWIKPAGAFQYFDALLKFMAIPRFVRGVEQSSQSAWGNQLRSFHVTIIFDLRYTIYALRAEMFQPSAFSVQTASRHLDSH